MKHLYPVPLSASANAGEFAAEMNSFIQERVHSALEHLVSDENKLWLKHGRTWGQSVSDEPKGELTQTSAAGEVPFAAIRANEVSVFANQAEQMARAMSDQIARHIYETVSAGAESVGNVVSVKEAGSSAAAFLSMLERTEFSVGRDGKVQFPSLHLGPDQFKKWKAELDAQGPEFKAKVDRLTAEKIQAALEREQVRLGKYE